MRSNNITRVWGRFVVVMSAISAFAATPTVSSVTAKQRYPWNGMVDITCNVSGIDGTTNHLEFAVVAVDSGVAHDVSQFWVVRNGTNSTDRAVHTNGTYHLVWDSKVDFDNQIYSNMVMRVNIVRERVQLWANGPYWATTNIGAEEPWEYGYYFWWGDTTGRRSSANGRFGFDFSWNNSAIYTYQKGVSELQSAGWVTSEGVLAPSHDAAHVHWGGGWRIPTEQELNDLNNKCDWMWKNRNGVNGYVVQGRGNYASASIFLPAAGYGEETWLYSIGSKGRYQSSVPVSGNFDLYQWGLEFDSGYHSTKSGGRYQGRPVRPVQGFTK